VLDWVLIFGRQLFGFFMTTITYLEITGNRKHKT
jgi:hypothetical protein